MLLNFYNILNVTFINRINNYFINLLNYHSLIYKVNIYYLAYLYIKLNNLTLLKKEILNNFNYLNILFFKNNKLNKLFNLTIVNKNNKSYYIKNMIQNKLEKMNKKKNIVFNIIKFKNEKKYFSFNNNNKQSLNFINFYRGS
jgi:hypothetical protein